MRTDDSDERRERGVVLGAADRAPSRRRARTLTVGDLLPGRMGTRTDDPVPLRDFARPKWIAVHVISIALAVAMVWLGLWQLHVSDAGGFRAQNFSYWLQWWLFAACVLYFWVRAMYLAHRPKTPERTSGIVVGTVGEGAAGSVAGGATLVPVVVGDGSTGSEVVTAGSAQLVAPASPASAPLVYRGYVMPSSAETPVQSHGDGYHDAYNNYLWELAMADGEHAAPAAGPEERPRTIDGDPDRP